MRSECIAKCKRSRRVEVNIQENVWHLFALAGEAREQIRELRNGQRNTDTPRGVHVQPHAAKPRG